MAKAREVAYLEAIIVPLCKDPKTLKIERKVDEMGVLLTISTNHDDCGTLVGKNGDTANCLRRLLHIFGAGNKARYNLKISSGEKN